MNRLLFILTGLLAFTACKNIAADYDKVQAWTSHAYNAIGDFDKGNIPAFVAEWDKVKTEWQDIVNLIAPYEKALSIFGLSVVGDTFDYIDGVVLIVLDLPPQGLPDFRKVLDQTQTFFFKFTKDLAPLMHGTFNPSLFNVVN